MKMFLMLYEIKRKTSPFQQVLIQCLQVEMPTSSDVIVITSLQNPLREITIKAPAGAETQEHIM